MKLLLVLLGVLAQILPAWSAAPDGIEIAGAPFPAAVLAKLPVVQDKISFGTDHGPLNAAFAGPLLWTVLSAAHAVDPAAPKSAVRSYVLVTGSDGYSAVIALGEIAPVFEDKRVILAETMNGKPLGAGHLRIVVPEDARGGRSVRDVVSITVLTAP